MKYTCDNCKKIFDEKYAYDRHKNRKTPCAKVVTPDPDAEFSCIHCGRSYLHKCTLNRHQKRCKMSKSKHSLVHLSEKTNNLNTEGNHNVGVNGDHNTTTNVGNTTNNITNITNININVPNITIYEREYINNLIYDITQDENLQRCLDELKIQIKGLLRKNKPHRIVALIVKFLHDNHLIPQGKNIFKGKGDLKDAFITRQIDGWAKTYAIRVIQTTMFELIKIMALVDIDDKNEKTRLCMATLNDQKNFDGDFYDTINMSVECFDFSKKNPTIDKLSKKEATEEKKKIIISPELSKIYEAYDNANNSGDSSDSEDTCETDIDESDELAISDSESDSNQLQVLESLKEKLEEST